MQTKDRRDPSNRPTGVEHQTPASLRVRARETLRGRALICSPRPAEALSRELSVFYFLATDRLGEPSRDWKRPGCVSPYAVIDVRPDARPGRLPSVSADAPAHPTPPLLVQKSNVRRPHSVELPSSTDQSKGVSPNSLPSLSTQLIIAMPAVRPFAA